MNSLEGSRARDLDAVIRIRDERGLGRCDEPVSVPIGSLGIDPAARLVAEGADGNELAVQLTAAEPAAGVLTPATEATFLVTIPEGAREQEYRLRISASPAREDDGIRQLAPEQPDGFRRLDTGRYILELCQGTAASSTSGKWGVRYFEEREQGKSLIANSCNALGGVYGPYFTPENGLVNPPEHAVANVTVLEEGPILCRYRLDVDVPDGLDPALHGSKIQVIWSFYHRSRWIDRTYHVTPYRTTIDGMPVADKITVGDEFEGGKGGELFTHFAAWPQTVYRGGDPYSGVLLGVLRDLLKELPDELTTPEADEFRRAFREDVQAASYDWFWRPISVMENLFDRDTVRARLREVCERARIVVREAIAKQGLTTAGSVDVTAQPEETAFVRMADKTAMINKTTGYSVVWYTSRPVRRYQIVERAQSGWHNWGTNGENEYPELPSGSTIRMAYGRFDEWTTEAARMESPVIAELA
jgi:hypothetical protein